MKRTVLRVCLLLLATLSFWLPSLATAKPFSQLISFAGPLSDTGNYASIHGNLPAPFYKNRPSNGPIVVDILAARFGLKSEPSLHLIGPPVGTNFATIGGKVRGNEPTSLAGQVNAYLGSRGYVADPDALYLVFDGGSDIAGASAEKDERLGQKIVTEVVGAVDNAIRMLINAGAKVLLVPNFNNLGMVPLIRTAGLSERAHKLSTQFNREQEAMLDKVERDFRIEIIRWDFYDFFNDLKEHGDEVRFTNTTESCLAYAAKGQCDFDRFMFLNEYNPTAKVHELIGNSLAEAVIRRGRNNCRNKQGMEDNAVQNQNRKCGSDNRR